MRIAIEMTLSDALWFKNRPISFPKSSNDDTIVKIKGFSGIPVEENKTEVEELDDNDLEMFKDLLGDMDNIFNDIDNITQDIIEKNLNSDAYDNIWSVMLASVNENVDLFKGLKTKFGFDILSASDLRNANVVYDVPTFGADLIAGVYGKNYTLETVSESVAVNAALGKLEDVEKVEAFDTDDIV